MVGEHGDRQYAGAEHMLNGIFFVTPKKGWAVGELGTIVHTADGGASWVPQTPTDFNSLKGAFFLNEKEGWVVGWPGVVYHTKNGGLSWTSQTSGTFNELYGVHFTDSNHGWIVGQFGEILHTKDGGQTWRFQPSGVQENLNKVYLADTSYGIIVGDKGTLLTTTNGGAKWEKQESGTENDLLGFSFSPEGMVAVGRGGIAMRYSIDTEQLPVTLPPIAEIVEEPEPAEEEVTVEEVTYHWDIIRRATWQTDFSDTYFLDEHTGWTVGRGGVIAHTTDGGETWLPQHSSVEADLHQVMFVDKLHGWITGSRMLLRTEDGGSTWQVVKGILQNFRRVNTMQFINPKEGWLGVGAAEMLHTTDGGLTWERQRTGMNENPIVDLHFINSLEGWAVLRERLDGGAREGGVILHTTDGGNYWQGP